MRKLTGPNSLAGWLAMLAGFLMLLTLAFQHEDAIPLAIAAAVPLAGGFLLCLTSWRLLAYLLFPVLLAAVIAGLIGASLSAPAGFAWTGVALASLAGVAILFVTLWRSPQKCM